MARRARPTSAPLAAGQTWGRAHPPKQRSPRRPPGGCEGASAKLGSLGHISRTEATPNTRHTHPLTQVKIFTLFTQRKASTTGGRGGRELNKTQSSSSSKNTTSSSSSMNTTSSSSSINTTSSSSSINTTSSSSSRRSSSAR
eukprot:GHVT01090130.1.p2 GENE.GHVT01090130.1~~GHVT01090130.1.p2  ORF type:complete len:142 (+),score=32.77 GHVT01090130.1:236-661(+)